LPRSDETPIDRNARLAAWVLCLALPADTVLYLVLPLYSDAFGITLGEAGMLLAANRLVRIAGYSQVARFYARRGDRATCVLSAGAAAFCALGYATLSGFWPLLVCRLLWGLSYAGLNLSTQSLATAEIAGAARRWGRSRARIAIGPMLALPVGAIAAQWWSPRPFFWLLAAAAFAGWMVARALPDDPGHPWVRGKRLNWPSSLDIWSFVEGLALDGLFIVGLTLLGAQALPDAALLLAGVLLALRYLCEIVLSPAGGTLAQKWGAERMLVVLSLTTCVALFGFGAGWLWSCAAAILVLRALQLPLLAPIVASRYPGPDRVRALASRSVWRDIGAGVGPMLAGWLIPVTSPIMLYGAVAACLGAAALATLRYR
jgi:DHA1 family inner membrane transport protein